MPEMQSRRKPSLGLLPDVREKTEGRCLKTDKKTVYLWISGFWGGVFLGALVACPAKAVSLPVSAILAGAFAYLARRRELQPSVRPK